MPLEGPIIDRWTVPPFECCHKNVEKKTVLCIWILLKNSIVFLIFPGNRVFYCLSESIENDTNKICWISRMLEQSEQREFG